MNEKEKKLMDEYVALLLPMNKEIAEWIDSEEDRLERELTDEELNDWLKQNEA